VSPVSVSAPDVPPATATRLSAVWGSLPHTLRPSGSGEIRAIDGTAADWPERVAAAAGDLRAIVLLDPVAVPADRVRALAARLTVPVHVRSPLALSPTVAAFRERWGDRPGWIRGTAHHAPGRTGATAVLDHLGLVRAAFGPVTALTHLDVDDLGHVLVGSAGPRTVHLQAVRTVVPGLARLALLSADREYTLELPPPGTARPGVARESTAAGDHTLPPVHEDGDRVLWRRAATGPPAMDLTALAADLDLLHPLLTERVPR
jgi:hypothetical protein